MAMNSLLIRAAGKWILVETGAGDKWDAKRSDIYAFEGPPRLPDKLATRGVPPEKIDIVINTHLHFDHCGWNTRIVNGEAVPTFPERALRRAARRTRTRQSAHRARPRQLFSGEFRAHGKIRAMVAARRRSRKSCPASS